MVWIMAGHPDIKRVVQKQIGQHGTDHPMDTKDNFVFERRIRLRRSMTVLDLRRKR
jgi:hypothetical protein